MKRLLLLCVLCTIAANLNAASSQPRQGLGYGLVEIYNELGPEAYREWLAKQPGAVVEPHAQPKTLPFQPQTAPVARPVYTPAAEPQGMFEDLARKYEELGPEKYQQWLQAVQSGKPYPR